MKGNRKCNCASKTRESEASSLSINAAPVPLFVDPADAGAAGSNQAAHVAPPPCPGVSAGRDLSSAALQAKGKLHFYSLCLNVHFGFVLSSKHESDVSSST